MDSALHPLYLSNGNCFVSPSGIILDKLFRPGTYWCDCFDLHLDVAGWLLTTLCAFFAALSSSRTICTPSWFLFDGIFFSPVYSHILCVNTEQWFELEMAVMFILKKAMDDLMDTRNTCALKYLIFCVCLLCSKHNFRCDDQPERDMLHSAYGIPIPLDGSKRKRMELLLCVHTQI